MTTYTITTTVNIDTLATKAGNDTYNINGGYLLVDQDSRYGANNNTSATMGNITLSASLGGTIEFNSTLVRFIPYDGGTGNVPASGTTLVSDSGARGTLIGVYSALNVAPTAAGNAMPASGYIKIKQWNGDPFIDNENISSIGAVVNGTDYPGYIEIVGAESSTITVNRLNNFIVNGDWYYFFDTTTSGSRVTTYQIPSNGTNVYVPGVWVETAVADTYEFYPCAGSRTALVANIATDERGKFCWISTAGLLRFGHDGTNSTGGYLPPAGRKIRIPNIVFSSATVAAPTVSTLPNATLATRSEFLTTGGGNISLNKCSMNWYLNISQAYSCNLYDSGIMSAIVLSEIASSMTLSNVGVGQEAANTQTALTLSLCFAGGTISDCTFSRSAQASSGNYIVSITDISGFTFSNNRYTSLTFRANATTGSFTLTRVFNCNFNGQIFEGGRGLLTTCVNCEFNNTIYRDTIASTTISTNPHYAYVLGTYCSELVFDGISFGGIDMVQPYAGLFNIGAAGCSDIDIRNMGSITGYLDLGNDIKYNAPWSRSTTFVTATLTGHNIKSGDIFYTLISSDTSAIAVGSKTCTGAPDANTFKFACTNAGATTGQITYFPTMTASALVIDAGAAAQNIRMQRCYLSGIRSSIVSSDNSTKNLLLESVFGEPAIDVSVFPSINTTLKGLKGTFPLTAQTSCYGTHFIDYHIQDLPFNTGTQSWGRTTTVATGVSPSHNMRTNMLINVTQSSDTTAIPLGQKTLTCLNSDLFTFTCNNAGATTGTFSYSPLASRVGILMNESTLDTSGVYTLGIGSNAAFTSAGGLVLSGIAGHTITFTSPEYILGHTKFSWAEPVMAGPALTGYNVYYSLDKNDTNGFGPFKNLSLVRTGSAGTNGQTSITVFNTSGVYTGDYVWGTNIAPFAYVTGIPSTSSIQLSSANIGTVSGPIRFNSIYSETGIDPSEGFKLKIKLEAFSATTTPITSLYLFTESTNTSRHYQYPLDTVSTSLNLINLQTGTEVHVYNTSTDQELAGSEGVSSSTFTYSYTWAGEDTNAYITVLKTGYQWIRYSNQVLGQSGLTIPVFQLIDRNYQNT